MEFPCESIWPWVFVLWEIREEKEMKGIQIRKEVKH